MSLYSYIARLEDTLRSRGDVVVESLSSIIFTTDAVIKADVRFFDGSRLKLFEEVEQLDARTTTRIAYSFHYQDASGELIFRYDNAPHYPHLATFPAHKHIGDSVIAADAPDLSSVLREIDDRIYAAPRSEDE
jgi:hypothetical protein